MTGVGGWRKDKAGVVDEKVGQKPAGRVRNGGDDLTKARQITK